MSPSLFVVTISLSLNSSSLGFIILIPICNKPMAATLQSLRLPLYPSIIPLNSYTFPTSTVHYSPKLTTFKGSFVVTRNKPVLSSKASSSQYSSTVTENLGDISIFTAAGEPVMFEDLWDQEQVTMLKFIYNLFDLKLWFFYFLEY